MYLISDTYSELDQRDIFWSLTGRYGPSPCFKWASSCSPQFLTLATGRCGACLAVLGEVSVLINSTLEEDIWSEHCQNPPQSSRQPKTTRATAHQSETGLNTSDAMRELLAWGTRVHLKTKKGKKVSRFPDDVFFHPDSVQLCGWTEWNPFLTNKLLQILTWIAASWI